MNRRIFTVMSVTLLLVCVVVALMWARSYMQLDRATLKVRNTSFFLYSWLGEVAIGLDINMPPSFGSPDSVWIRRSARRNTRRFITKCDRHALGFGIKRDVMAYTTGDPNNPRLITPTRDFIVFPYWFAVLLTAVLTALFFLKRYRARRPPGLCPNCFYDLRASKDRCPECGTPIPASHNPPMKLSDESTDIR